MKNNEGMEDELIQEVTEYNQITCLLVKKDGMFISQEGRRFVGSLLWTSPKRL
jgi:hypothetical protein